MKIIKLKGVHYLSYKGITLTMNQPYVEATEENLEKLSDYLKLGFVEIKELDEDVDKVNEYKPTDLSMEEKMFDDSNDCLENEIVRFPSLEELEAMNKKELMAVLDKYKIKYKQAMKKEELIKLILD